MRGEFSLRIKSYLLDRTWYKLVDALEEVTNYWSFGRDFTTMPTYGVYVPTRNHILDKPDMMDAQADDLSYRFNLNRVSPAHYLNTLKGNKMMPQPDTKPKLDPHKHKFYKKWRRLSNSRMQGFSTINNICQEEEQNSFEIPQQKKPQTFLSSILNQTGLFG